MGVAIAVTSRRANSSPGAAAARAAESTAGASKKASPLGEGSTASSRWSMGGAGGRGSADWAAASGVVTSGAALSASADATTTENRDRTFDMGTLQHAAGDID